MNCTGGFLGALVLLAGCSTVSVRGEIDGETPPIEVSMFLEDGDAFGAEGLIAIVLSSEPNACRLYEYFLDEADASTGWRGYSIGWQKTFPDNFWQVSLVLRTGAFDGTIGGQTFTGIPWDAVPEQNGQAYGRIVHYVQHPRPDAPDSTDWFVEYLSAGGTLEIGTHEPGERLEGRFTAPFVDPADGAARGDLDLKFDARVCPNISGFAF
ncbi:MAG: hypothetical protein ACI8PZ_000348 [Myxococcota bacterium]